MADVCRACSAPIIFAATTTGKTMPVDANPDHGGNVRLAYDGVVMRADVLGPLEVLALDADERAALHYSHFATCPHADRFRRG